MAPKKADAKDAKNAKGKGKGEPEVPTLPFKSLYLKREPLEPAATPDVSDIEVAWKGRRNHFTIPLEVFDAEAVNMTEWKPTETQALFKAGGFAGRSLPKTFLKDVVGWKRATSVTEASGVEEEEPQAQSLPDLVEEEPVVVDPKAKGKAKAEPKAKAAAKGKAEPEVEEVKTTAVQWKAVDMSTVNGVVVTAAELRTRETQLNPDANMPALSQAMASQFGVIVEHRQVMPKGSYLWELIFPQDAEGVPLYNPHGKYIVKLFVQGQWRQVLVDDVVPVGLAAPGSGCVHANLLPTTMLQGPIWPQLLAKALFTAFPHDAQDRAFLVIHALTGFVPVQHPYSWNGLASTMANRMFCVLQRNSELESEAEKVSSATGAQTRRSSTIKQALEPKQTLAGVPHARLGGQPSQSSLQCLICECILDLPQIRVKAAGFRPAGGKAQRVVLKDLDESEGEDYDEEEDRSAIDRATVVSEFEELNSEDDEGEARMVAANTKDSTFDADLTAAAGGGVGGAGDGAGGEQDAADEANMVPMVWPADPPAPFHHMSLMTEFRKTLEGGFWIPAEALENTLESFFVYIPPGPRRLSQRLVTSWDRKRDKDFPPPPLYVLKFRLKSEHFDPAFFMQTEEDLAAVGTDSPTVPKPKPPPPQPAFHRVVFMYEPQRPDLALKSDASANVMSCNLQNMTRWSPKRKNKEGEAPDFINLSVGERESDWTSSTRSFIIPSGEHWYLVQDDAWRAGSVLTVHVDASFVKLSESSVEFEEFSSVLAQMHHEAIPIEPTVYATQVGYCIWAKAEVQVVPEVEHLVTRVQVLTEVDDPSLRLSSLRLRLLRFAWDPAAEPTRCCCGWVVTSIVTVPMLPLMSLPLFGGGRCSPAGPGAGEVDPPTEPLPAVPEGWQSKYVIIVEANNATPCKGGQFSLRLMVPPWESVAVQAILDPTGEFAPGKKDKKKEKKDDAAISAEADVEPVEERKPPSALHVTSLDVTKVVAWSGQTSSNPAGLVLRERFTIPMEGPVTAALRVSVEGLPSIALRAVLLAQLPPEQEWRAKSEEASQPPPYAPGDLIDPKDYSGRLNFLASCKPMAEESGQCVVVFPHVLFAEGSTYRLDVFAESLRPDSLEGGTWKLELRGSGEVEVGEDCMERDLENLVYDSFEVPNADPTQPLRKDVAARARLKWRREHGLAPQPTEEELAKELEEAQARRPSKAEGKPPAKGGKKDPKNEEPPPPDPALLAAAAEAEFAAKFEQVLARVQAAPPCMNDNIAKFLHSHAVEPAVLVMEETDAPDEVLTGGAEDEKELQPTESLLYPTPQDLRLAKEAEGFENIRRAEVEEQSSRLQEMQIAWESAKTKNTEELGALKTWREANAIFVPKFLETRNEITGGLQARLEKRQVLTHLLADHTTLREAALEHLRTALTDAEKAGVSTWDPIVVKNAEWKIQFMEASPKLEAALDSYAKANHALAQVVAAAEAEAAAAAEAGEALESDHDIAGAKAEEDAARTHLSEAAAALRDAARELLKAKVPLPPDVPYRDLLMQSDVILKPPPAPPETAEDPGVAVPT